MSVSDTPAIVDAIRTPFGARNGKLAGWHPADLAAELLRALVKRNKLDPATVGDVILGCVAQVGAQAANVARSAVLAAGWPDSVPATTVDRQCGSSLQAVQFAAYSILAGGYDAAVAGGVEVTSIVGVGAPLLPGCGVPFGPTVAARYQSAGGLIPSGIAAERTAARLGLTRQQLDAYAARSQLLSIGPHAEMNRQAEIVGCAELRSATAGRAARGPLLDCDELPRRGTSSDLADLRPAFEPTGMVTAGNSAPVADGAAALLLMKESAARTLGLQPRARLIQLAVAAGDPTDALSGLCPVTALVLRRSGLTLADIDRFEVHESFSVVVLGWLQELRIDSARVNVNGGALAFGHAPGATGASQLTRLLCELERSGGRYGLAVVGELGGQANAAIIERIPDR